MLIITNMRGKLVLGLLVLLSCQALDFEQELSRLKALKAESERTGDICELCHSSVGLFQDFFLNNELLHESNFELISGLCAIAMPWTVCHNLVTTYGVVFIQAVGTHYFDPDRFCARFYMCEQPKYVKVNITMIVEDIMKDAPAVLPLPPPSGETYKFIHVSDIHLDTHYETGASMDCKYPLCCRSSFGVTNDTAKQAGYWGSPSKCDLPLRTVEAFLKQATTLNASFVFQTGDDPSHAIWLYTPETHLANSEVLSNLFYAYFPTTQVYPIMGNHAGFPQDQYHYGYEQWLLEGLTAMWEQWLPPQAQTTHLENAYYSIKDPATGVRVLGINTQMCDNMNLWLILNDTDPANHLQWLRSALYAAEQAGEAVFIIGHIPPGDHFCASTWATVYRALVNRFRNTIRGQFFGHTHKDQFEVVESLQTGQPPAGVVYVVPGMTSFSYHSPCFRLYEADKSTHRILNFYTYCLDLATANTDNATFPQFHITYDPISLYNMTDLSPASWAQLSQKLENSPLLAQTYWEHYTNPVPVVTQCDGNW